MGSLHGSDIREKPRRHVLTSYALPKAQYLHRCTNTKNSEIHRFLPEEVVEEILLRLPAESLMICKRVCKLWLSLIGNPSFVNKHLRRVTNEHRKISSSYSRTFVVKRVPQHPVEDIFSSGKSCIHFGNNLSEHELSLVTICNDDGNGDQLPCVVEQISLLPPSWVRDEVRGFPNKLSAYHCNGIIHMFDRYNPEVAILLNPILREFKLLRTPSSPTEFSRIGGHCFLGSGFGYDHEANVYKYVKIYTNTEFINPIALVYTMGSRSSWRLIKIDIEGNCCYLERKGVYCKGAYYWLNNANVTMTIICFDMCNEKFHSLPVPDHLCQRMNRKFRLLEEWKESICVFIELESSRFSATYEMWVMADNFGGVRGSTTWTKHLVIGPVVRMSFPLAFWKDDELLIQGIDGRVISYNIYTQNLRNVPLSSTAYPGLTSAFLCLNSLVSFQ